MQVRVTQANSTVTNGSQVNPSTVSYKLFYSVDHSFFPKFNKHEAKLSYREDFYYVKCKKGAISFQDDLDRRLYKVLTWDRENDIYAKVTNTGSAIGHRIDYNGVGVVRD